MKYIFVNLKRFDVPEALGGLCPESDSVAWARGIMKKVPAVAEFLGRNDAALALFFPASLLPAAVEEAGRSGVKNLFVGSQSVFREDVAKGGNFGAFTSNFPAKAAKNLGCSWSVIGHSEERKDKFEIIASYDPAVAKDQGAMLRANAAVNGLVNKEALRALEAGLNVLLCVGETLEERGEGSFQDQKPRIEAVLKSQLEVCLKDAKAVLGNKALVLGYEPRWAIGPGKIPPDAAYIEYVTGFLKATAKALYGLEPAVVYGGGLKTENAAMLAGIKALDGGLIALTKFTPPIGFSPEGLDEIVKKYFGA